MGELIPPKDEVAVINVWSEEHDHLPLKQRVKVLLARNTSPVVIPDSNSEKYEISNRPRILEDNSYKDGVGCDKECVRAGCSLLEGKSGGWSGEENHTGEVGDCRVVGSNVVSPNIMLAEKVKGLDGSHLHSTASLDSVGMNFVGARKSSSTFAENSPSDDKGKKHEAEKQKAASFVDELEHIVLKERQRLLISSQTSRFTKTFLEGKTGQLPTPAVDSSSQQSSKIIKEISFNDVKKPQMVEHYELSQKTSVLRSSDAVVVALPCSGDKPSHVVSHRPGSKSIKCGNLTTTKEKDTASKGTRPNLTVSNFAIVMVESLDMNETSFPKDSVASPVETMNPLKIECEEDVLDHMLLRERMKLRPSYVPCLDVHGTAASKGTRPNLTVSNFASVKVESLDMNETSFPKDSVASPVETMNPLKIECEEDVLDHMLLRERMKLRPSYVPCLDVHGTECTGKMVPCYVDCRPMTKESPVPLKMNRPRKKRKTATDSVLTALEEDAPGLLQVLVQKGVSVDEIRLYGQPDYEDGLDDFPMEENFGELEAIISKIFSQRSTLLKLSSMRYTKGDKASYCLGCLFSLVEQARYLQFRKWPVEWGWCRDLQAFIFVFKRHHRIVLERPEYGYATYFFELTVSLPINWQVQRLITALKLSSCSRATLIENKALVVGEDITEGEAKVLVDYGWVPNTGLGTMLSYCDRVYHDRKTENPSEWRSKIGKILADGYNGGSIVSDVVAKKLVVCSVTDSPGIKLETL